jgi:hypothetical protein
MGARFLHRSRALVAVAWLAAVPAAAETLYVATLRDQGNATPEAQGGALFTVDPQTAAYTLVAPLRIGGVTPVGITGLSIHPRTGVFYGLTAGSSANIPRSLVTIDPTTGNVTLVGSLGHTGSDIRFDAKGVLYAWLTDVNSLATVDLGTGIATPLPQPQYPQTLGGGIAFDKDGKLYVSVSTSAGTLDVWKPGDEKVTTGPTLNGAPFVSAVNSMAFSDSGMLYAVNSNMGAPAKTRLIRIDRETGRVTDVGALPADVDPLAFAPSRALATQRHLESSWSGLLAAGAALFVAGFGLGTLTGRRRRP